MKRTFLALAVLLLSLLLRSVVVPTVSAQGGQCDGWASEGSEHRNSGNGCVYKCSGGSWEGPKRCDGKGNGQFQGAAAKTAEERRRQEEAVRQRQQEAEKKVQEQGAAATAAVASGTAEQRAKEAARQQSMVEAARQAAIARGVSEVEANRQAQEASQLVSQAQETSRGAQIVGSSDQRAAEIAAKGYDPNSSLALTGNITQSTTAVVAAQNTAVNPVNTGGTCDQNSGSTNSVSVGGACCRGGISECNADTNGTCMTDLDRIGTVGYCGQKGQADTAGFCGDSYCQPAERGTPESPNYCAQDCANTNERGDTLFRIEAGRCVACQASDTGCVNFASCRRGTSTDPAVVSPQVQNAQNRYVEAYRDCFFDEVEFTEGTLDSECIRRLNAARESLEAVDPTGVTRVQPTIAEERTVYSQTFAASQAQESCRQYQNASDQIECTRAANAQTDQARREREEFCRSYPDRCDAVTNNANGYRTDLQDYYQERAQIIEEAQETAQQIQNEARQNCANAVDVEACLATYEARITQAYNQVTLLTGENAPMCATRPDLCQQAQQQRAAALAAVENSFSGRFRVQGEQCVACVSGTPTNLCPYASREVCVASLTRSPTPTPSPSSTFITTSSQADLDPTCGGSSIPEGGNEVSQLPCGNGVCDTGLQLRLGFCRTQVPTQDVRNAAGARANESCGGVNQTACGIDENICDDPTLTIDSEFRCTAREADPDETNPQAITTYPTPEVCDQSGLRGCQYNGGWACVDPGQFPVTRDSSRGCQAWLNALNASQAQPEIFNPINAYGQCEHQPCRCNDNTIVRFDGGYCEEVVTAILEDSPLCAHSRQAENPAENIYCCEGLVRVATGDGRNMCQSPSELPTIEQNLAQNPQLCTYPDGCSCENATNGAFIDFIPQGASCPTSLQSNLPNCPANTVPHGTDFSTVCQLGTGWAGQCQSGFQAVNNRCEPRTAVAFVTAAACRLAPLIPGCPDNPNGQVLTVGQTCQEGATCFCPTGRMDGNTCRSIEQITVGETCADAAFCQCREGKLVGGRCAPDNDASFCLAFQGGERCTDGYRYRCNISVYPTGRLEWTGETCGERICVPGRAECTGESSFRICREDGTGWIENNACASGFICVNDERRCFDNRPFTIPENRCTLTEARDYAVNLPQCGSGNYICQYGPARSINGRFVCPDPTGSFGHGCPDGMYWEGLANECRYRANAVEGIESYAGYQCTGHITSGSQQNLCQACGRINQPPCRNCYGDVNTVCSTEPIGNSIIVPANLTDQQHVNQTFGFACNASAQCFACGGSTGRDCPIAGLNQDIAHTLVTDCESLRQRYPQEYNRLCSSAVSSGSCQFISLADQANSPIRPELRQPYFICTTNQACSEAMANPPFSPVGYGDCQVR